MSKIEKYSYYFLFALFIYIVIGFKLIPYVVHTQLVKNLDANLTVKSHIKKVEFNPFIFQLKIHELKLGDINKPVIAFDKFVFDLDVIQSIFESHVNIKEVILSGTNIELVEKNGEFNLAKLLKKKEKVEEKTETKEDSKKSNIKFLVAKIVLEDTNLNYKKLDKIDPFSLSINNLDYFIYNLGTYKDALASSTLSFKINKNTLITKKGAIKISPSISTYGNFSIKDLRLSELIEYKRSLVNFELDKKASFNLNIDYNAKLKEKLDLKLNTNEFRFSNINISQNKEELIKLKNFSLEELKLDLLKEDISISSINLNDFFTKVTKNKEKINLLGLVNLPKKEVKQESPVKKEPKKPNNWNIELKQTNLNNINLDFKELEQNLKINANKININVNNTQLANENISVNSVNVTQSSLIFKSKKDLELIANKLNIDVKDISLKNENINVNSINILQPNFSLKNKKDKTNVSGENINIILSKISKDAKSFRIKKSDIKDASFDIKMLKKDTQKKKEVVEQKKKEAKKNKEDSLYLDLGAMDISNMTFNFQDHNLPLVFNTSITKLNGHISQFKTDENARSVLKVDGIVNEYGLANIKGLVNPYDIKFLTDIQVLLRNIAVKEFTPYSGKFVGRELKSGKLDVDLKYNIEKSNLDATNSIIITKLEFGDDIESKDAISLPLGLAIALLEDSNGVIDLNIPVSGNVDNPKFEIAPLVWKTLVNLVTKAITAPFSFIGSVFGFDEDEIKYVKFDYADSTIGPIQKETLDKIAQILPKKPKLVLNIDPSYDNKKDSTKLKEIKYSKLISKTLPNKQILDYDKKYLKLLESFYLKDYKTLNLVKKDSTVNNKIDKKLYLNNLEKHTKNKILVNEKELKTLGLNRAKSMKTYLIKEKLIKENQLLITDEYKVYDDNKKMLELELKLKAK